VLQAKVRSQPRSLRSVGVALGDLGPSAAKWLYRESLFADESAPTKSGCCRRKFARNLDSAWQLWERF